MNSKYLVIDKKILPDVYEKVLQAKELLRTGEVKEITEVVKCLGISRSTFYKYKDYVFTFSEGSTGRKVTISFLLSHQPGLLSSILNIIADGHGNILTINQDIPVNNFANVSITFDITHINKEFEDIFAEIRDIDGVSNLELIAME